MPLPTPRDVHVDAALSNLSVAFMQSQDAFIADKVFPRVPVSKQSDRFFQYTREDWFRDDAQIRGPGDETAGGGFRLTTGTYACNVWGYHKDVDEQVRANADAAINVDRDATEFVTRKLLLRREREFLTRYFAATVWTGDQTGVAGPPAANQFLQWNDPASNPIQVITTQQDVMEAATGFRPNVLVLGPAVARELKNHADIVDRIRFTQRGIVTEELLAAIFGVEKVLVARAVENTADENQAGTFAYMAGRSALLCYAAPSPGLLMPSAGYIFAWSGLLGAGAYGVRVSRIPAPLRRADRIEAELAFAMNVIAADLGRFFITAVAA